MKSPIALPLLYITGLLAAERIVAESIHAVVAVHRHGDRTWKGAPPTQLTSLGAKQCFESGQYYRSRYLNHESKFLINGISESNYDPVQIYAIAPDQTLLAMSGQAFLQGLYPPKSYIKPITLANGQDVVDPSGGQQFTIVHTIPSTDPETIWLKSDENCPNYVSQSNEYLSTAEYKQIQRDTMDFYKSFKPLLEGVISDEQIGFQSAYNIFDYFNVGLVHNSSLIDTVSEEDLFQLRVLADRHEVGLNGRVSDLKKASTISGRTIAHKIVNQLDPMLSYAGKGNKFSLLMASYDTFIAFFAHAGLQDVSPDFKALPELAASMVFELFTEDTTEFYPTTQDDLKVRFLFKNGSDAELQPFPIFGQNTLSWADFQLEIGKFALTNIFEWCAMCSSSEIICPAGDSTIADITNSDIRGTFGEDDGTQGGNPSSKDGGNPLSPAVAGAVGAVAALIVSVLAMGLAMAIFGIRLRTNRKSEYDFAQSKPGFDTDSARSVAVEPGKV